MLHFSFFSLTSLALSLTLCPVCDEVGLERRREKLEGKEKSRGRENAVRDGKVRRKVVRGKKIFGGGGGGGCNFLKLLEVNVSFLNYGKKIK